MCFLSTYITSTYVLIRKHKCHIREIEKFTKKSQVIHKNMSNTYKEKN